MMKIINNKWAWVVVLLVVLNIGTLSVLWIKGCRHAGGRHERFGKHHGFGGQDYLKDKLGLSDNQKEYFDQQRIAHFNLIDSTMREIKVLREKLFENIGGNVTISDSLIEQISHNERDLQVAMYRHFNDLYNQCNDNQKQILKKELKDMSNKMGRGHGHQRRNAEMGPPEGEIHPGPPIDGNP